MAVVAKVELGPIAIIEIFGIASTPIYLYSGGSAAAAGAKGIQTVINLQKSDPTSMLREGLTYLNQLPANQRVLAFNNIKQQIMKNATKPWYLLALFS
ncbi:MAG: hypothetical protein M3Q56_11870 [Bacteroidota bacterium]|nr:hypothetical protein [Bacteroidota bacterium]